MSDIESELTPLDNRLPEDYSEGSTSLSDREIDELAGLTGPEVSSWGEFSEARLCVDGRKRSESGAVVPYPWHLAD